MTGSVRVTMTETGIGLLTLDPPQPDAAGQPLLQDLTAQWAALGTQPGLKGIVLRAEGRHFAAGLLRDDQYDADAAAAFCDLCAQIEASPVPVVTAIRGGATGAGLELALAAHYRIADHQAHLALPGILAGLLPLGGTTQRLPRLVGVQAALEILLAGRSIIGDEADRLGLIDAAVSQDANEAAESFLRDLIVSDQARPRPVSGMTGRLKDYAANAAVIGRFRVQQARNPVAAGARMVDCVEAAFMMPFDIGLGFERAAADDVAASLSARALCHLRRAQNRVMPAEAAPVRHVAIAGGGEGAAKLAVRLLDAGIAVALAAPTEAGRRGTQEMIARLYHLAEAEGRLTEQALARRIARLALSTGLSALDAAEVVFVPLPSGGEAAQQALRPVIEAAADDAALAVLAQGQSLAALTTDLPASARIFGVSFATDPLMAGLAELSYAPDADPALLDRLHLLGRRMGLSVLRRSDHRRSLCARIASAGLHAADQMLVLGASPYQIDKVLRAYGFAEGPYERIDSQGLDRAGTGPGLLGPVLIGDARMGRNAGRGYYRYDGQAAQPDPAVMAQLEAMSAELAIPRRGFSDAEILRRFMAAMANEGARLLERGQAEASGDVDLAVTAGYGLASWRGGPMFQADQTGLVALQRDLASWTDEDPDFWEPAALISDMIKNGRHFSDVPGEPGLSPA